MYLDPLDCYTVWTLALMHEYTGYFDFECSRALPQSRGRSALFVSKGMMRATLKKQGPKKQPLTMTGLLRYSRHSSCLRSVTQHFIRRGKCEWICGLDGGPETRFACMDGPVFVYQANYQSKSGLYIILGQAFEANWCRAFPIGVAPK